MSKTLYHSENTHTACIPTNNNNDNEYNNGQECIDTAITSSLPVSLSMNSDLQDWYFHGKLRPFPGKSDREGMKWTRRKMSWSSFQLSEIYSWGLGSQMPGSWWLYDLMQIIHELQSSVYLVVKKRERHSLKGFQSCLWRLLVFVVTSRVTAGLWGESSWVRRQSHAVPSATPPPLPGEGHLQMLGQLPQSAAFIINILLKMDPHCPENKVRLQVCNVAPQIISHSFSYFKPVPLLIYPYAVNNSFNNFCLGKFSPFLKPQVKKYLFPWNLLFSCFPTCSPFFPTLAPLPIISLLHICKYVGCACVKEEREIPLANRNISEISTILSMFIFTHLCVLSKCMLNRKAFLIRSSTAQIYVKITWIELPEGSF